ncbi:MAG: tRNA uridine-5-carboxymethylaminomethyl(34) synthesis GTPase MnmE [Candidatus Dadabacteria bacterium]|nr:MAG: tRNA uridine-5-carboxymethylaminomethyl(34) synthesis GTPase MnmE [Candidatus Dadabacteria bacterium]
MEHPTDTIAAVATPPGTGGIAIVRVSGPGSSQVARAVLRRRTGAEPLPLSPRAVRVGSAVGPDGRVLDEVLALWMPGPASYTREDVLEIHCHGGPAAAQGVLGAALAAGARLARPGEFTLRAFLNGRIDLVQAEAVLDVIQARTQEALRAHEALLAGALSEEVGSWQHRLGRLLARVEAHLDFPEEEDVGSEDWEAIRDELGELAREMGRKLETFGWGRTIREGYTVALVGVPNVGKSSLLNRLVGEERAIVTELPGTTRDLIDGWTQAAGVPVRILDTAGLRAARDPVEAEGVRRAERARDEADAVILVCEAGRELLPGEEEEARRLAQRGTGVVVVNKADLGPGPLERLRALGLDPVPVSARTGQGLPALLDRIAALARGGASGPGGEAPLTRERHRAKVEDALAAVRRAGEILGRAGMPEVGASELHAARRALAELLGWGTPDDVLDQIFSQFCIGK